MSPVSSHSAVPSGIQDLDPAWVRPGTLSEEERAALLASPLEARLDYLLAWLIAERTRQGLPGFAPLPAGTSLAGKQRLFRSLCNVREPAPVDADYVAVQDSFLREHNAQGGFVSVDDIPDVAPAVPGLRLWQGDITRLSCGAIVNAANSGLLGCFSPCHNCIDNIIHTKAGVQLRLACASLMERQGYPEPVGQAKITSAFNLPASCVLHTVGPAIATLPSEKDARALASCYTSCLATALAHGISSVAFCCISTGVFNYPKAQAADLAVSTVQAFLAEHPGRLTVVFNTFGDEDTEIYRERLARLQ